MIRVGAAVHGPLVDNIKLKEKILEDIFSLKAYIILTRYKERIFQKSMGKSIGSLGSGGLSHTSFMLNERYSSPMWNNSRKFMTRKRVTLFLEEFKKKLSDG